MTAFSLLTELCESRLISSRISLKRWDERDIADLGYLYLMAMRVLLDDDRTRKWAQEYCEKAGRHPDFAHWRTDANDLYVLMYALTDDHALDHTKTKIDGKLIRDWLRHTHELSIDDRSHRLFNRLDTMFDVHDSDLKSMRRSVAHWHSASQRDQQNIVSKLIRNIKKLGINSELLTHLKKIEHEEKDDEVKESASSGATGAASVATVVGGLGAGFKANGHRGIYEPSKPVVIRRNPRSKKKI